MTSTRHGKGMKPVPEWWSLSLLLLVLVLVGIFVPVAGLVVRRRWLAARGWVVDCSLRFRDTAPGSGWMLGVARFHDDDLEWYRVFSLDVRPRVVIRRGQATMSVTRLPSADEASVLYGEQRIVDVDSPGRPVSLAMVPEDMMALLSWSEAGAPGDPFKG